MVVSRARYCYLCRTTGEHMAGNYFVCSKCKLKEPRYEEIYHRIPMDAYHFYLYEANQPFHPEIVRICPWLMMYYLPEDLLCDGGL